MVAKWLSGLGVTTVPPGGAQEPPHGPHAGLSPPWDQPFWKDHGSSRWASPRMVPARVSCSSPRAMSRALGEGTQRSRPREAQHFLLPGGCRPSPWS